MPLQNKSIAHTSNTMNNIAQKNQGYSISQREFRSKIHVHPCGYIRHTDSTRCRRIPSSKEKRSSSTPQRMPSPSTMPQKNKQSRKKNLQRKTCSRKKLPLQGQRQPERPMMDVHENRRQPHQKVGAC